MEEKRKTIKGHEYLNRIIHVFYLFFTVIFMQYILILLINILFS